MAPPPEVVGRAPGAFSPLSSTPSSYQRPSLRKVQSTDSDDSEQITYSNVPQNAQAQRPSNVFTTFHHDSSSSSLQNFSRPSAQFTAAADSPLRIASPLVLPPRAIDLSKTHTRKHSNSQGFFEPTLPTAPLLSPSLAGPSAGMPPNPNLSASQIAAQAAMHNQSQHMRQRSQTLPTDNNNLNGQRKGSRGPVSPPMLSLTEASVERQNGFGSVSGPSYRNGLLAGNTSAAALAANVVFHRSPQTSPNLSPSDHSGRDPDKPAKAEKSSKVKLFSRPGKIGTKDTKEKALASPNKLGALAASLQRSNMSSISLAESAAGSSMYSMANSSSATIRPMADPPEKEKEKDKEKKHHFLSRQKHKLSGKDDHHLPLSSAASNSRPADPNAPSSLYNFSSSPATTSSSFTKSMSGLDLRHGGRALREKKQAEKSGAGAELNLREVESANSDWPGPSSLGTTAGTSIFGPPSSYNSNVYGIDPQELARYGLNNMTADDAWPFLKAKLLIIFEGEDLKIPVEDLNRLVTTHLQRCIQKRAPNIIVEDFRDLLNTGFSSLDQTLRRTDDDRLIPLLTEVWRFTFTVVLPFMQAVFLPLDLEFSGNGPLMTPEQAREFWGALPLSSISSHRPPTATHGPTPTVPAGQVLEVRRIVLTAYRDTIILPRFDTLKTIFSRLSLDALNTHHTHLPPPPTLSEHNLSSSPDSFHRPGTAMSLDPAFSSYSSQSTTLLGGADSSGARSRAISNVSYGSDNAPPPSLLSLQRERGDSNPLRPSRPFTPGPNPLGINSNSAYASNPILNTSSFGRQADADRDRDRREREVNALESSHVTETVGRMLQCMSIISNLGPSVGGADDEAKGKMEELCRSLKLNWLGRGRTGRNRRGLVGARVGVKVGATGNVGEGAGGTAGPDGSGV